MIVNILGFLSFLGMFSGSFLLAFMFHDAAYCETKTMDQAIGLYQKTIRFFRIDRLARQDSRADTGTV